MEPCVREYSHTGTGSMRPSQQDCDLRTLVGGVNEKQSFCFFGKEREANSSTVPITKEEEDDLHGAVVARGRPQGLATLHWQHSHARTTGGHWPGLISCTSPPGLIHVM